MPAVRAQVLLIEGTRGASMPSWSRPSARRSSRSRSFLAPDVDSSGGIGGDPLPDDLGQLQPFDTMILADVPKGAPTENQQKLLEANVHDMGAWAHHARRAQELPGQGSGRIRPSRRRCRSTCRSSRCESRAKAPW